MDKITWPIPDHMYEVYIFDSRKRIGELAILQAELETYPSSPLVEDMINTVATEAQTLRNNVVLAEHGVDPDPEWR